MGNFNFQNKYFIVIFDELSEGNSANFTEVS